MTLLSGGPQQKKNLELAMKLIELSFIPGPRLGTVCPWECY